MWNPVIGSWLDEEKNNAMASGLSGALAEIAAGKAVLGIVVYFPLLLVVLFGILFFMRNKIAKNRVGYQEEVA